VICCPSKYILPSYTQLPGWTNVVGKGVVGKGVVGKGVSRKPVKTAHFALPTLNINSKTVM